MTRPSGTGIPALAARQGTIGDIWLLHSQAAFGIGLRSGDRQSATSHRMRV
ncbi:hypothetical protein [Nitrobacter hamburgensis]|uniref:hypothetical protein n=1 Tax=Nitrobacter hamburgensis TaxID=912 RepID=UPI0002D8099F|nr:hypothetical protein [Nitrobacter hamburgensis]